MPEAIMDSSKAWEKRYSDGKTGWDIGKASPALIDFAVKHLAKDAAILIPGCGHGHDGKALWDLGFTNVTLIDWAASAKAYFLEICPNFPQDRFLVGDAFALTMARGNRFDAVLECTFFCAIPPSLRSHYIQSMAHCLRQGGTLAGLLFTFPLTEQGPPFGGDVTTYLKDFQGPFNVESMQPTPRSIAERKENEVFFVATLQQ